MRLRLRRADKPKMENGAFHNLDTPAQLKDAAFDRLSPASRRRKLLALNPS